MSEWDIYLKKPLVDIFWWNPKPFKKSLSHIEEKKNFLSVYKVRSWKVKIVLEGNLNF